jgi:hypothetical protein
MVSPAGFVAAFSSTGAVISSPAVGGVSGFAGDLGGLPTTGVAPFLISELIFQTGRVYE